MGNEHCIHIHFTEGDEQCRLTMTLTKYDASILLYDSLLSVQERKIFDKMKVVSRQIEFLAGRYIAKKAITHNHPHFIPELVSVIHGVWGFPLVQAVGLTDTGISIAHTNQHALAVFCPNNTHPIGADIEEINEENRIAIQKFLLKSETSLLVKRSYDLTLVLWSAKEAAGKALRVGFNVPESLLEISSIKKIGRMYHIRFSQLLQLKAIARIWNGTSICVAYPSVWEFNKTEIIN
jgi:4'-phosphopantetheinyl transferase EntD